MAAPQDGDILKALIGFVYNRKFLTDDSTDSAATACEGPPAKCGQLAGTDCKSSVKIHRGPNESCQETEK